MGARRCQKQQEFRRGKEIDRFWTDYTRQNKHDGEKYFLRIFVAMLNQAGICGHENDHDDARMVGLRWSDDLSLCRENRGRRHDTGPL